MLIFSIYYFSWLLFVRSRCTNFNSIRSYMWSLNPSIPASQKSFSSIRYRIGIILAHWIQKKFLTRPLRTFRSFQKALKKLLIRLKWIELHLKNSRDNLSSCGISAESCNKAKHRGPTIELFCFRSHVNLEI